MGAIIAGDDRPICWTPLSPERSTSASTAHNNTPRKERILRGDGVLEESRLSSKLLLHFYIKSQLECQMSFQPSPDTARQGLRRMRGRRREASWVSHKKEKNKASNSSVCQHTGTLSHHLHLMGLCIRVIPLASLGEGIQPEPFALTGKEQHVILHLIATVST